ncbi:COX15/CtaA family protein [Bacillaceae bacterium W0354]
MRKIFQPKPVAVISLITMLFVLIGGALVTKTESGLGCGRHWPLCNGKLIPDEITFELVIEFSHRAVSGLGIIFVLILSYIVWKNYLHIKESKFLIFITILFIIIQSLLGALAVLIDQNSLVKALHFGISLISFAAVFLLTVIIFDIDGKFHTKELVIPKKLRIQYYSIFIYTLIVVYTGALVRHMKSSLVCRDWPFCFNDQPFAFSDYSIEQWVQVGHRFLAGLLLIWVISLFVYISRHYKEQKVIYYSWAISTALIVLQVLLGALIIFTLMNVVVALMHALMISLFFAVLSYLLVLSRRSALKEK